MSFHISHLTVLTLWSRASIDGCRTCIKPELSEFVVAWTSASVWAAILEQYHSYIYIVQCIGNFAGVSSMVVWFSIFLKY